MQSKYVHIKIIVLQSFLVSQLSIGGDTELKHGESKNNYNFSEVFLNVNMSNDFMSSWVQFEFSQPPELGLNINGLRKFRVDYAVESMELSIGDIYKLWGRGLILNQFDDQDVNLDNGLRGISVDFISERYNLNVLSGLSSISRISNDYFQNIDYDARKPNHLSKHSMFGSDIEFFHGSINTAFSFLQSRENHPLNNPTTLMSDSVNLIHRVHGFRSGYENNSLSVYVESSRKKTSISDLNSSYYNNYKPHDGISFYGNINYYNSIAPFDGWSLAMEYKNYNITKLNPADKDNFVKHYDMNMIFTQPPTVIREHSSVLLARLIPQVNFNDEVGYQLSLVGPVGNLGYFTLNYQEASRTSLWSKEYSDTTNALFSSNWVSDSSSTFMPLSEKVALPYREFYIEMEGYLKKLRYQFGLGITNRISEYHLLYNSGQNRSWDDGEPFIDLDNNSIWSDNEPFTDYFTIVNEKLDFKYSNAITLPTLFNYPIGNGWSIDFKYEFQRLENGTRYISTLSSDEFFEDLDQDGTWDMAELFTDANNNGQWDDAEETWYDWWLRGWIPDDQLLDYDLNGNGSYDIGEEFTDLNGDNLWNDAEELIDTDGDGQWDDSEPLEDINSDGIWTRSGTYVDSVYSSYYSIDNNLNKTEKFQNNHMVSLGLGKSPIWSIALTIESSSTYEYGPVIKSIDNPIEVLLGNFLNMDNKWVALEVMININNNTRLDLMYGTLRGGIICSNGICRYVEPFDDGFKLTMTSVF